jgi:hypothetical protein
MKTNMKKKMNKSVAPSCVSVFAMSVCVLAVLQLGVGAASAQSSGSGGGSFSAAYLIPTVACNASSTDGTFDDCVNSGGGPKVLFGNIKTPSAASKNVLVMATLESSLLTSTSVASKGGNQSTSSASGAVIVKPHVYSCPNGDCTGGSGMLVDITTQGGVVTPSIVTFNQRLQTLSASLAGLNCTAGANGVVTCLDPETISLLLSTMSANGFNFLVQTPGQGVYQVQLEIAVAATASSNSIAPGAQAQVAVGAGSLVTMIVQTQTPFDTIKVCPGGPQNGPGPANCGPGQ